MLTIATLWRVLAGIASLVALLGLIGALLSLLSVMRMRRDLRTAEAAERLERVDLSDVVQRYVPLGSRTQNATEEIALVKQTITQRRPHRVRMAIVSSALMVGAIPVAAYFLHKKGEQVTLTARLSIIREDVNALSAVRGVWGWKADFAQSCQVNPQTISVSGDRKTVSVDYAKTHDPQQHLHFAVVATPPNGLVLKLLDKDVATDTFTVHIDFLDSDTFLLSNSQFPMASAGSIERCPPGTGDTGTH